MMTICNLCGKDIKKFGMGGHMRMAHTEEGRLQTIKAYSSKRGKSYPPWNKGLTKETDMRIRAQAEHLSVRVMSTDHRKNLSIVAKRTGFGGYNPKGGRGKKGWYKGFWCDSSWELAWIIYFLERDLKFERNTRKFPYLFEGKMRNYIPDFITSDGMYIEIKGFMSEQAKSKFDQFPNQIILFGKEQMKTILEEVVNKYGKNFITLYEEDRYAGH